MLLVPMRRVSRHMGSHLLIKILMLCVSLISANLVMDEEREKSHNSLTLCFTASSGLIF